MDQINQILNIAANLRCRTLSTMLRGVFHANDAGVDMDGKRIWIYQIQPNAQIADSRSTNKLLF